MWVRINFLLNHLHSPPRPLVPIVEAHRLVSFDNVLLTETRLVNKTYMKKNICTEKKLVGSAIIGVIFLFNNNFTETNTSYVISIYDSSISFNNIATKIKIYTAIMTPLTNFIGTTAFVFRIRSYPVVVTLLAMFPRARPVCKCSINSMFPELWKGDAWSRVFGV